MSVLPFRTSEGSSLGFDLSLLFDSGFGLLFSFFWRLTFPLFLGLTLVGLLVFTSTLLKDFWLFLLSLSTDYFALILAETLLLFCFSFSFFGTFFSLEIGLSFFFIFFFSFIESSSCSASFIFAFLSSISYFFVFDLLFAAEDSASSCRLVLMNNLIQIKLANQGLAIFMMQSDELLQQWKEAKKICLKIVQIAKAAHLHPQQPEQAIARQIEDRARCTEEGRQTNRQFLRVYDTIYRLCSTKDNQDTRVEMVYRDYEEILKKGLLEMTQHLRSQKDICKLVSLKHIWDAFCDVQKRLTHMFAYLNKPYQVKEGKLQSLQKTSMNILLATLFTEHLGGEFEAIYFKEIDRMRVSLDYSNKSVLASFVDILYRIHFMIVKKGNKRARTIYTQFQAKYLRMAREYYQKKYRVIKEYSPPEYFTTVHQLYQQESVLVKECYAVVGDTLINWQFSEEFIQRYRSILLSSPQGLKAILKNRQIPILKVIIDLNLKLTKNIDGFREQFQEFVCEEMRTSIEEMKNDFLLKKSVANSCQFISRIIKKNQQFVFILENALKTLGDFAVHYKSGVERAFNSVQLAISIQDTLTVYIDSKLKSGSLSEDELEEEIINVIRIFSCLRDKDIFMCRYSQRLAKRMLVMSPQALRGHELFIKNLRLNCGGNYTERLQTVINEYHISLEQEPIFKDFLVREKLSIGFTIKMFSDGAWPTPNILEVSLHHLPAQIQEAYKCLQHFRDEQLGKKIIKISGLESKIRWIYYFDKQIESSVDTCYFDTNCLQAAIVYYLYRNRPNCIQEILLEKYFDPISPSLLKQNLHKLSENADGVLKREGTKEEPLYRFNGEMRFSRRLLSFQLGTIAEEEKLFQQQDIGKDREVIIDANIAKLMKSRKIIDFDSLITEIVKMVKLFVPSKRDIKMAADRLISKDLLRRDQHNMSLIKYID